MKMIVIKRKQVLYVLVVSICFTGSIPSTSFAGALVMEPIISIPSPGTITSQASAQIPAPTPSPSPGPVPVPTTSDSKNISTAISAIQNSQAYGSINNSQTVEKIRTINDGLAGTGLAGAAAQTARFTFTYGKALIRLWLLAK